MTSSLRILSTSSVDSVMPSLLLVNPDGTKYLVGCGEGSQRLMLEHQQKLATVTAVCCPVLHHSSVLGLPGWILTATDVFKNSRSQQLQQQQTTAVAVTTTTTTTTTATTTESSSSNSSRNEKAANGTNQMKQGPVPPVPHQDPQHHQQQEPPNVDTVGVIDVDRRQAPAAAPMMQQQQQLLNVFGPRGTREFVNSLRHFIKPRGYGPVSGHGDNECDAVGASHHQQQQRHGQQNPFGNVRVWEGETVRTKQNPQRLLAAEESEDGVNGPHGPISSCTSNSGFDRFSIRCYAFHDRDTVDAAADDDNDGIPHEAEPVGGVASASDAPYGSRTAAAADSPSFHNKRPYSQVGEEHRPGDGTSEEPVRTHDAYALPPDWQRQRQQGKRKQELSFLFSSPPLPGKFLPHEAAKLGVPKGPMYGQLKAGQSVTFDAAAATSKKRYRKDNNSNIQNDKASEGPVTMVTVHPWKVVAPDSPGVAVLVLHYATKERLAEILRSEDFRSIASDTNCDTGGSGSSNNNQWQLEVVVHMTPQSEWMEQAIGAFASQSDVEHVWLSTDPMARCADEYDEEKAASAADYGTPFRAAALGAATRHAICESVYQSPLLPPALRQDPSHFATVPNSGDPPAPDAHAPSNRRVVAGRTMMEYVIIPRAKRGWAKGMTPSPAAHDAPTLASSSRWVRAQALQAAREVIDSDAHRAAPQPVGDESEDPGELFFTGTGSAIPCKHRNVTGMCVTATNGNRMLLDVGEGTVGQLLRRVVVATSKPDAVQEGDGRERALSQEAAMTEYMTSIRAVWISHSHADHHLGLLRLLQERRMSDENDPVMLIAPACIFQLLEKCEEIGLLADAKTESTDGSQRERTCRYRAVHCWDLVTPPGGKPSSSRDDVRSLLAGAFGWTDIQAVPVDHCPNAFAVVLDGTPFGRLVYSGDCRPSRGLARLASPTDLLIHEATFEDGMEAEAKFKKHSTVGEALSVADEMNASCVVLTHFSQRYPRIPPLSPRSEADSRDSPTVVFAFDYMRLTPMNLVEASRITDDLRLLYCGDSTSDPNERLSSLED
jgi:ribonuclease Z